MRSVTLLLVAIAISGALSVILLSPLALERLPVNSSADWSELSDMGQTYGAASAILAALALGGVAISLVMQRREAKAAREQALRGLHTDLLRMALDSEEYLACWGPIGDSSDLAWYRQHIYLNLIVSHWQMMWEIGAISEDHLRITSRGIFGGALGRRFWREARQMRSDAIQSRRERQFHSIIDSEYLRAAESVSDPDVTDLADSYRAQALPHDEPDGSRHVFRGSWSSSSLVRYGLSFAAGVAVAAIIQRRPKS